MKKSKELMSRMFDSSDTPERHEKPYKAPMWYYITTAKEDLMWSHDNKWIEHDLQHTIPLVFKSSVRARRYCIKHGITGFAVKGSRFVKIGGLYVSTFEWL
jgi:hypothetical protein